MWFAWFILIPIDIIAGLIYMGFKVTPKAYFGILIYVLLQPMLGIVMAKMMKA